MQTQRQEEKEAWKGREGQGPRERRVQEKYVSAACISFRLLTALDLRYDMQLVWRLVLMDRS